MKIYLILFAGFIFYVIAYKIYYKKLTKASDDQGKIKPNKWSWMIWIFSLLLEAITFNSISGDWIKSLIFFFSSFCCLIITIRIWKDADWKKISWIEAVSVTLCIIALITTYFSPWHAHLMMIVGVPISFIPTYKDAWDDYKSEDTIAWLLWFCGDFILLILILLRLERAEELPYILVELFCHLLVFLIVLYKKKKAIIPCRT